MGTGQRAESRPGPLRARVRGCCSQPPRLGTGVGSATSGFGLGLDTLRRLLHHQGDAQARHRRVEELSPEFESSILELSPTHFRAPAWRLLAASPFPPAPRHAAGPAALLRPGLGTQSHASSFDSRPGEQFGARRRARDSKLTRPLFSSVCVLLGVKGLVLRAAERSGLAQGAAGGCDVCSRG